MTQDCVNLEFILPPPSACGILQRILQDLVDVPQKCVEISAGSRHTPTGHQPAAQFSDKFLRTSGTFEPSAQLLFDSRQK